jgi:hypothetical protein
MDNYIIKYREVNQQTKKFILLILRAIRAKTQEKSSPAALSYLLITNASHDI